MAQERLSAFLYPSRKRRGRNFNATQRQGAAEPQPKERGSPNPRVPVPLFTTDGTARRSRSRSSAEFYSAVSRICNPLAATESNAAAQPDALPNGIRRYGRFEICATPLGRAYKKFAQACKTFTVRDTDGTDSRLPFSIRVIRGSTNT
jgi:hypothetical protein